LWSFQIYVFYIPEVIEPVASTLVFLLQQQTRFHKAEKGVLGLARTGTTADPVLLEFQCDKSE
jgi:hypothetical protein